MPPHNALTWKGLVESLSEDVEFGPPADEDRLAAAEQNLGSPLPLALREFLAEADGVKGDYGSGIVWSAAEIEGRNQEFRSMPGFRSLYMPFDHLLFFGADAGGDQFAYAIQADGRIHNRDIYRWDHETDSRSWHSARLEQYFEHRLRKVDEGLL